MKLLLFGCRHRGPGDAFGNQQRGQVSALILIGAILLCGAAASATLCSSPACFQLLPPAGAVLPWPGGRAVTAVACLRIFSRILRTRCWRRRRDEAEVVSLWLHLGS